MDHAYIEDNQIVDRYLMGRLSEEEAERFADHSIGCPQCLDSLALGERMQRGMRRVVVEGAFRAAVWTWWARAGAARRAVLAVAIATVIAVPVWLALRPPATIGTPGPQANVPVVRLSALRGPDARPPAARLALSPTSQWLVFALEVDGAGAEPLRVKLMAGEARLWMADDLRPNASDELVIGVPSAFLTGGDYRFLVERPAADGGWTPLSEFSFRADRP